MLLARQGARVLKIESPSRPDPAREMSPAHYGVLNAQKELVPLELTTPEGQARFQELVRQADGLIEGYRPSAKKKLGLDEQTLLALNPKLCIASLIGFPENGPDRDRAGHDLNFQALTGTLSLFGEMPALPLADYFTAYQAALSLTAAMDAVSRGASGQRLAISMTETLQEVQAGLIEEYRRTGELPNPGETLFSGVYPCYRLYRAGDGRRVAVGALEAKFWEKVCTILGTPDLVGERYATGEKGEQVSARIQKAFASRAWNGRGGWGEQFAPADCCVEPVLDYSEIYGV
jgi:crotonobetainyl-CoA:carnitine CoA-transferase CaiB-like acyl-CoA transferase